MLHPCQTLTASVFILVGFLRYFWGPCHLVHLISLVPNVCHFNKACPWSVLFLMYWVTQKQKLLMTAQRTFSIVCIVYHRSKKNVNTYFLLLS